MIGKQSWTCLYFLLFFTVQERCDACAWINSQYKVISNFCLSLLREMDGEISDTTTVKIKFPHFAYDEADKAKAEDKVRFLAEATEQIIILFDAVSRVDEVKWDSRALEDFLNILSSRQLTELKKCTATYAERAGRSSSERKLRKHFRKLKKILKKAKYSADSLEQIRNLVQQHLWRMGIIADNVKQK
ncbi:interferon a3-like [Pangasianodon hypophthalmus]|uniref:interferon a3-like n=1 Tax=Pangasianodon hypophthalmus TaxID=310915 RepID=UPI000EFE1271|nr:interferon a3-like [Pangasianodon hypophthalmus]